MIRNNGKTLRELRIHNFDDLIYAHHFDANAVPTKPFRGLPEALIPIIRNACPQLETLAIDMTQKDVSSSRGTLEEFSSFRSLKYLQLNTVLHTEAVASKLTIDRVLKIARTVWSPTLRTFRLRVGTFKGTEYQRGKTKTWLTTQCYTTGDLTTVDEIETLKDKRLKAWARELKTDEEMEGVEGVEWESKLRTRIEEAGIEALKALR